MELRAPKPVQCTRWRSGGLCRSSERTKPPSRTKRVMSDMEDRDDRNAPAGPADFDDTFRRCHAPNVRSLTVAARDRDVDAGCVQDAFMRAFARWRPVSRLAHPPASIRPVRVN